MDRRAPFLLTGAAIVLVAGAVLLAVVGDGGRGDGAGMPSTSSAHDERVTLIGDSQVQRGPWAELLGIPVDNQGVGGLEIRDVTALVGQVVPETDGTVVVWAGTNDVFRRGTDEVEGDLAALLAAVEERAPGADVVVLTVPLLPGVEEDVREANAGLRRAAERAGAQVLDVTDVLAAPGRIDGDGVHLTATGYEAVGALLREVLARD
ncbi:SGNH/GDSL hydrolase family protein [Ornithinimicrobium cerasi]|uniref:Lysophospholipase L1 n=1 Tax=Ornithinimicrobium cerasi TaxID=2248773 RepID=A0A285VUX1_9MICO|nr:GDSL-type esterase/lipase family protein [Ornithinimicrobium cerasi]SOC57832.1 Lysophospholipase L1 [Ornithinimicrobium cerasi]SOC58005.1 Lysophospholipase L1 [Ornithinimicrobium cerasi]